MVGSPRSAADEAGETKRSFRDSLRSGWRPTRSTVSGSAGFAKRRRIVARYSASSVASKPCTASSRADVSSRVADTFAAIAGSASASEIFSIPACAP